MKKYVDEPAHDILLLIAYVASEGSDESSHPYSLVSTEAAHAHNVST